MTTLVDNNENGLTRTASKALQDLLRNLRDASSITGSALRTGKSKIEKHETIERTKDRVEVDDYVMSLPEAQQAFAREIQAEIKSFG